MARKQKVEYKPWLFKGEPFTGDMADGYAGFVYLITDLSNGKMYIGKKNFTGMRKKAGAKKRSRIVSDWERYFSSNDYIKECVKVGEHDRFKREIISLHTHQRDVNFNEIREQYVRNVLDAVDEKGERLYYNDNINGKHFPHLVSGWRERSSIDPSL